MTASKPPAQQRQNKALRTVQAVLWSFVGLRKNAEGQHDIEKLNPFHIIGVAIGAAFLFVLGLFALVNWIVLQPTGL
jgi:amino acid transporter